MTETSQRLVSLDVFRGITIAAMILVNNPGTSPVYWPLEHAEWHGLTPTDWIFPFFLFIVGVAIPISLGRYKGGNPTDREGVQAVPRQLWSGRASQYKKILIRAVLIFLLGLSISVIPFFQFGASGAPDILKLVVWLMFTASLFFLLLRNFKVAGILAALGIVGIFGLSLAGYNIVPYNFGTMRIFGVLQRIAVCYFAASLIFLHTNWKQQLAIAVSILLGYWFLMTNIPVPGCEITTIDDKACNLAAYLDRLVLGENHIWRFGKVYDPEGILSTLPSIATTISGGLTGKWLVRNDEFRIMNGESEHNDSAFIAHHSSLNKVVSLFFTGTVLLGIGLIWNSYFPMNKSLWTSSYVVVTTGLALLVFAACFWLIDIKGFKKWSRPFAVFGMNALALFVFSGIFARMISSYRVSNEDHLISIQKLLIDSVFLVVFQPVNASLAYAICFILFWLFLFWLLFRKQIFIKV